MTQYTKPTVLPAWAESAGGADVLQPSNAEIQAGWPLSNVPPSRKRFNWVLKYLAQGVRYILQRGMPEWDAAEDYRINDRVMGSDGKTYKCIQAGINKDPTTQTAYWTRWGFTLAEIAAEQTTPAQFDSTTKTATTAFCRLNGVNHAPWSTYTAAGTTLAAGDCGRAIQVQLPVDGTIYLPLTSACASGATIHIVNTSATTKATILTQAPDALLFTPTVLQPNEDVWMVASPQVNTWFLAGGTGVLQSVGAFSRSIGGSGYQKLPGGFIIQWGQVGNPANYVGSTAYAFNLPIAFPNNHHLLIASNFGSNNLCEATQGQIGGLTKGKIVWAANHSAAGSVAATYISIGN